MLGYWKAAAVAVTISALSLLRPGKAEAQVKLPEGTGVHLSLVGGAHNVHFNTLPGDTVRFSPLSLGGDFTFSRDKLVANGEYNIGIPAFNALSVGTRLGEEEERNLELGIAHSNVGLSLRAAASLPVSDKVKVFLRADLNPASLFTDNIAGGGKALEAGFRAGSPAVSFGIEAELRRRSMYDELPKEQRRGLPPAFVELLKSDARPELAVMAKLRIRIGGDDNSRSR